MDIFKEIEKLSNTITSTKKLTLEKFTELDQELMELQFEKMNDFFEELRTKMSNIEIVEDELVTIEEPTPSPEEEDMELTREEIKKKYTVAELKQILKDNGVSGYSGLKEDELIDLIIENNIQDL